MVRHPLGGRPRRPEIGALRGASSRTPLIAVCFAIILFSLTGLPPTAGFVGKFLLFAPVIQQEFYLLAVVGLLNGAVSLYYYAQPLRVMFLQEADEAVPALAPVGIDRAIVVALTVPLVVLGLYGWGTLSTAAAEAVAVLP